MLVRFALAAALLCAPAAALAGEPAPKTAPTAVAIPSEGAGASLQPAAPAAAPVKAAKPAKKLICKREAGTGSRTNAPKLCLTKEEWKAIDREG